MKCYFLYGFHYEPWRHFSFRKKGKLMLKWLSMDLWLIHWQYDVKIVAINAKSNGSCQLWSELWSKGSQYKPNGLLKWFVGHICVAIYRDQSDVAHVTFSVFYLTEKLIWRGTFCWKPHLNRASGSKVTSNWMILRTIENNRNSFLFLAMSHNQCCRLLTDPARSQHNRVCLFARWLACFHHFGSNKWVRGL